MLSPEGRKKIVETNENRPQSKKALGALFKQAKRNRRRVKCLDTGMIFPSILAAAIHKKTYVEKLKYWISTGKVNMEILD